MNGRRGTCKGACCKTPFGVCAKSGNCGCHYRPDVAAQVAAEDVRRREADYQYRLSTATAYEKYALYRAKQTRKES